MSKELLIDMIKEFYPYAKKQLGFDKNVKIKLKGDQENARHILGKTGFYDPENMEIYVFTTKRHPKDILRSIAHELVHHAQNCRGELNQPGQETGDGYAQKDPHLRKMEAEAYEKGNLIFRDWEDSKKQKKVMNEMKKRILKEQENDDQVNPLTKEKANDHYALRAERVFKKNMEKLGIKEKTEETKKEEDEKK